MIYWISWKILIFKFCQKVYYWQNSKSGFVSTSWRCWKMFCVVFEFSGKQISTCIVHKRWLQFVPTKNVQNEELFWILNKIQLKRVKIKNFMNLSAESLFCVGMAYNQYEKWSLDLHKFVELDFEEFAVFQRRQKLEIREKCENPSFIWLCN